MSAHDRSKRRRYCTECNQNATHYERPLTLKCMACGAVHEKEP